MAVRPDLRFVPHQTGRLTAGLLLATLCAVCITGCNSLTRSRGASPLDLFSQAEAPEEASPFRDVEPAEAAETAAPVEVIADFKSDELPPEVEAELATMPVDEQAEWREMFRTVDPAMIPMILEARRLKDNGETPKELASATPAGKAVKPIDAIEPADRFNDEDDIAALREKFVRRRKRRAAEEADRDAEAVEQAVASTPQPNRTAAWPPRDDLDADDRKPIERAVAEITVDDSMPDGPTPSDTPIEQVAFESDGDVPKQPAASPSADDVQAAIDTLISELERELAAAPQPASDTERDDRTRREVFLRMLYLMNDQQARSLQSIPGLEPPHQEFWTQLFWGLTNYFDSESIPEPSNRASEAVSQLRAAARAIQSEARLELRAAAFCNRVDAFGNITRYERDEFLPGEKVLAYVEVRNFTSQPTADGQYRTQMKTTTEIYRGDGSTGEAGLVMRKLGESKAYNAGSLLNDYFNSYEIVLPSDLTLGPHILKLIVEDELSHRVDTATLPFVVK